MITRRDFLDGAALTVGASVLPFGRARAEHYPPATNGLRGSTAASYAVAHALRDGERVEWRDRASDGSLDLIVVGAGLSGLAAARFFQQRHPDARILLLDNHDDFGGHARRCEMPVDGRTLISYGGSESLQSPHTLWSARAVGLLSDLGVDLRVFESAFHRELYQQLGLARGVLFKREDFGVDRLVRGDPTRTVSDAIAPAQRNARSPQKFIAEFPLNAAERERLIALYTQPRDFWPQRSLIEKMELLSRISYRQFLLDQWRLTPRAAAVFQQRPQDFFAVGIDLLPALAAAAAGYPGFQGLNLPTHPHDAAKLDEPYIHHFPDGNASVARLLVRKLMPAVAPGVGMEDIVTARFDYSRLDNVAAPVRLRLNATVIGMANTAQGVDVGYVWQGRVHRVTARQAIYAGYHMMLPYLMPELAAEQRVALTQAVKAPLVYTKLAVRHWRPWLRAGVHDVMNPRGFYSRMKLDYPVSLGGYRFGVDPSDPTVIHLVHVPLPKNPSDQRTAWREGRAQLYETAFSTFEAQAYDELQRVLGTSFVPERDVAAISVYRWGHGYAYGFNSLFDSDGEFDRQALQRRRLGRVAIANSDAAWSAYAHAAIDEAARAVDELSA